MIKIPPLGEIQHFANEREQFFFTMKERLQTRRIGVGQP